MSAQERQQKSIEWLTHKKRAPVEELPPIHKTTIISKDQLDRRIKFLYDDTLAKRRQQEEERNRKMEADLQKNNISEHRKEKFSGDDEDAMVRRLYEESIQRKEMRLAELREREAKRYPCKVKTVSKATEAEYVNKLYNEGMERERNKHIKLFEKYVLERIASSARAKA